jgi:hypothetical protein
MGRRSDVVLNEMVRKLLQEISICGKMKWEIKLHNIWRNGIPGHGDSRHQTPNKQVSKEMWIVYKRRKAKANTH